MTQALGPHARGRPSNPETPISRLPIAEISPSLSHLPMWRDSDSSPGERASEIHIPERQGSPTEKGDLVVNAAALQCGIDSVDRM